MGEERKFKVSRGTAKKEFDACRKPMGFNEGERNKKQELRLEMETEDGLEWTSHLVS